ncbi:mucin-4-like, partial [Anneissia japonica]|uniref:mucin-4-like n=1 Tax=Anneissia japonica TaxID=1529436 RepID=UPI0014254EF3
DFFFAWGLEQGDNSLSDSFEMSMDQIPEKVSPTFRPTNGFPFFGDFIYSIYFTENGVIVLSRENERKVGLAYPPIGGITINYPRKVIAPYWADSDLSNSDIGEVYYSIYSSNIETVSDRDREMLSNGTDRVRTFQNKTLPSDQIISDFVANWMLVVTWDKVPQYPVDSNTDK